MEFDLQKINVSTEDMITEFEYDEEKGEIVFVINGVEKRVKIEDMITETGKLQEQNTALEQEPCEDCDYKEWLKGEIEPFINKPCVSSGVCEHDKKRVLDKIRAEIEGNMESIIGKYDSSIPKFNMPSYKIERNKAREECISIIDKYKAEKE